MTDLILDHTLTSPSSLNPNKQTLKTDMAWWLIDHRIKYDQYQLRNHIVLIVHNIHDVNLIKKTFNTKELKPMIQTINRPQHTYDQFTNNPLKLLAQSLLPLRILRKLWNIEARWIELPKECVDYAHNPMHNSDFVVMKPHIEDWLENNILNIKVWNNGISISIQFKTEELAALFKLTCL